MKHYKQIIINIEVKDDLPEEKLDTLIGNIFESIEAHTDVNEIKIDSVRVC